MLAGVRYHDGGNGLQARDDLSCIVEPTHMRVAGGEKAVWLRAAWILLDREEQLRHGLIEASAVQMCRAYCGHRRTDPGTGTETQRGFDMGNRDVGLARPTPEETTDVPATREIRVECQGTVNQRDHGADVLVAPA